MADTQRPSDDRDLDTEGNDGEKRPWRLKSDPDEAEDGNRKSGSGSFLREVAIIVGCVLLLTWLLQTFIGRQYVIPSESMESTLIGCDGCTNDRIVIDKLVYRFGDPEPGDVVVFKGPSESWNGAWVSPRSTNPVMHKMQDALSWFGFAPPDENNLVKRVIATGGQTIECRNDEGVGVKVDGKPLREPYINMDLQRETLAAFGPASGVSDELPPCLGPDFGPIKVPEGNVWVMGDNRLNSQDSRYHVDDQYQGTVPVSDIRGKVRTIIYPFSRIGGVGSINPQQ
ncbi:MULTISPECIES: signal peptidase I [Gordonia]|uniref:signal peptidase I n=1 Tax=Gordonia TaxID=2053 RepID=UPI000959D96A|nr:MULTISPECIES: signal peptidase I [Gordonia]MDH3006335.1 signal peptidase I [Gordonia alkanivorans]MDH3009650.1 signal peptidase I [Gordonia alkanivorans]MDH3014093.1 signal peptidase I [Gordonia alkanivorans]MDH3042601.1 signal peptidase I [Gordonia alkanivorans]MDH3061481.1 signal peptidase I [Gordonia alkanivorans]